MSKLLVVDDDPDILETLVYAFEQEGFDVTALSDGESALESARETPPDIAVLDVMLPGLNGYEVSRLLKQEMRAERLAHFPILMLTARRVGSDSRLEFLATWSGADATMWKPYDLRLLLFRIRELLDGSTPTLTTTQTGESS